MDNRTTIPLWVATIAVSSLAIAAPADAQTTGQVSRPGTGMQAKMAEFQQIREKLDGIRDQALEAPELEKKRDALEAKLDAAMKAEDLKALEKKAEFEKLRTQMESAQASGNREKMGEIGPRLQQLGQSLQATQTTVMNKPEIAAAVESFQDAMIDQMKKVNPETESLMARAESLAKELQSAMGRPGAAPSGP